MFKTLLTSTFLLFNVSTSPNVLVPKNAYSRNTLYGNYCLRDEFVDLADLPEENYYTIYENNNDDWQYVPHFTIYHNNYNVFINYWVESIKFEYLSDAMYFEINYESTKTSDNNYQYEDTFNFGQGVEDTYVNYRDLLLYFPQPTTVGEIEYKLFTSMFTGTGNAYVTYYSGYYSVLSPNEQVMFNIYGSVVIDNKLFNNFYYTNGNAYCELVGGTGQYEYIIGGKIQGDANVLIGGTLIANRVYQVMEDVGIFSYVYSPVEYTFGDMIFSVVDAPIYMLSQLFSFELFGIQFYVAFMSIVTVILICFIIKKVI